MTVSGSTLSANSAYEGGGIWNEFRVTISGSTLSANVATYRGGGIANYGTVTVKNSSSITGNSAPLALALTSTTQASCTWTAAARSASSMATPPCGSRGPDGKESSQLAPASGLHAGNGGVFMDLQTNLEQETRIMSFTDWLSKGRGLSFQPASRRKTLAARRTVGPCLECLEDRWVLSTLTVLNPLDKRHRLAAGRDRRRPQRRHHRLRPQPGRPDHHADQRRAADQEEPDHRRAGRRRTDGQRQQHLAGVRGGPKGERHSERSDDQ